MASKVENLESGDGFRTAWTTTPADYSITANDPFVGHKIGLAQPFEGRPCRQILVLGSGTLVVTGLDGTNVTIPAAGVPYTFNFQATGLVAAGSTATNVVVIW
jgi:hypothetical protein